MRRKYFVNKWVVLLWWVIVIIVLIGIILIIIGIERRLAIGIVVGAFLFSLLKLFLFPPVLLPSASIKEADKSFDGAHESGLIVVDQLKTLRLSIAHPRLFSKRFSSPIFITIYKPDEFQRVEWLIAQEFQDYEDIGVEKNESDTNLVPDLIVVIKLSSIDIEFSEPVTKKIEEYTTTVFTGKPIDTCYPGFHTARLSITDKDTSIEYVSKILRIQVVDFAFDHVSRPHLSMVVSGVTAMGALATFILTLFGQIDAVLGYSSGTAALVVGGFLMAQYKRLYKTLHVTTDMNSQP